jgi:hypothetical protein
MGSRLLPILLLCGLLFPSSPASASDSVTAQVTRGEAQRVCKNWIAYLSAHTDAWSESRRPSLRDLEPVTHGDTLLAWHARIAPTGYIIVPARMEFPAILAYSETATWLEGEENPFLPFIRNSLKAKILTLSKSDLGPDRLSRSQEDRAHSTWGRYLRPVHEFEQQMESDEALTFEEAGPLLTSRWHQDSPYNAFCPTVDDQRTWLGCTATATSQLMNYHQWPVWGEGLGSYWWDGDDCEGDSGGEWIEADFELPFDWANMPDMVDAETTPEERAALSDFGIRVATSLQMDFSTCGSESSIGMIRAAFMNNFHYRDGIRDVVRFRYTDQNWFNEIRDDIDQGHPILYTTILHAMVCDGWRDADGLLQIHLNYGWGGASNNWYTLDDIETSLNPWAERMLVDIEPDLDVAFPLNIDIFQAVESEAGMEVSWEVPVTGTTAQFWVMRSGGNRSCVPLPLMDEPLTGQDSYYFLDDTVISGEYHYWLKAITASDETWFGPAAIEAITGVGDEISPTRLHRPSPNPANPRTDVAFTLAADGPVQLRVLDVRGRIVSILAESNFAAGDHVMSWNGRTTDGQHAPSGAYFIRLQTDTATLTQKVTLAR